MAKRSYDCICIDSEEKEKEEECLHSQCKKQKYETTSEADINNEYVFYCLLFIVFNSFVY